MAKIDRYQGNLQAFASGATGQERVVFGQPSSAPTQSDDLTENINAAFTRGWGTVPLGDKPPREWFNSAAWVSTQLSAYLHQVGVAEWDDEQEYHKGSIASIGGFIFTSKLDDNVGNSPLASVNFWHIASSPISSLEDIYSLDLDMPVGVVLEFSDASWRKTGTGATPSQSPVQNGDGTATDATGGVWSNVSSYLSLEQFGAVGDASDENDIIQAALNYGASVGRKIYGKPNTVYGFTLLEIPSNTGLVSVDESCTFRLVDLTSNIFVAVRLLENASNIRFQNVTFDFNRYNRTDPGAGLSNGMGGSSNTSNVTLRDVTLIGASGRTFSSKVDADGLDANGRASNYRLYNVTVLEAGNKSIQARQTDDFKAVSCRITSNVTDVGAMTASGIESSNSTKVRFIDCDAVHTGLAGYGQGWRVVNNSEDVQFIGGSVTNGRQGLFCADSRKVKFIGQYSKNSQGGGLIQAGDFDDNGWGFVDDVLVTDYSCEDPQGDGIVVDLTVNGVEVKNIRINDCSFTSSDGNMDYAIRSNSSDIEVRQSNIFSEGQAISKFSEFVLGEDLNQAERYQSGEANIDDDDFIVITPPRIESGVILVSVDGSPAFTQQTGFRCNGTVSADKMSAVDDSRTDATTGALTGTTGTDGNITVSADTGVIYIENRVGASRRFRWTFLNVG